MTKKLLALSGCQSAGKDTISNKLWLQLWKTDRKQAKFADSLNQAVSAILGIDKQELQDRELKETSRFGFENPKYAQRYYSSRDVQKIVGSNLRTVLGSWVFVNALANTYQDFDGLLIISDLRYENEYEWVKSQGGVVVYVHNEKAAILQYQRECVGFGDKAEHHPPESEMFQWAMYRKTVAPDYWLDNNDYSDESKFDDFVKFVLEYLAK